MTFQKGNKHGRGWKPVVCKIEGCEKAWPGHKGYCAKHYQRLRKHGDPLVVKTPGWAPGDPNNPSLRPESRAALSALRKASVTPPETREKIRQSMVRRLQEPELRAKWVKNATGRVHSAETRRKIGEIHSRRARPIKGWIHKADKVFSQYIRISNSDGRGNCRCFTCDAVKPIAEMDCGHFVSRQHKSTRWMEKNAHPQCRYCNRYNEGRKDVYSVRLIEKYGPNILLELQEEKNKVTHWTEAELKELIQTYKAKLESI